MRNTATIHLAMLLSLLVLAGCNTPPTTTTITTTTVECTAVEDTSEEGTAPGTRECITIDEETTTSHRPRQCHGILSCSFWVTGEAIALPFRALGVALDVVF